MHKVRGPKQSTVRTLATQLVVKPEEVSQSTNRNREYTREFIREYTNINPIAGDNIENIPCNAEEASRRVPPRANRDVLAQNVRSYYTLKADEPDFWSLSQENDGGADDDDDDEIWHQMYIVLQVYSHDGLIGCGTRGYIRVTDPLDAGRACFSARSAAPAATMDQSDTGRAG
eukprot:6905203-Pyramimonas_sp.AAC.1